jgi:hypothetical protein
MRFRVLALLLAACGGAPAQQPIENTAHSGPGPLEQPATGSVRIEARTATGGKLRLVGERSAAMAAAAQEMAGHCGVDNYVIVQDGEEVVGKSSSGELRTAWCVHYMCSGASPIPPPP